MEVNFGESKSFQGFCNFILLPFDVSRSYAKIFNCFAVSYPQK